MSFVRRGIGSTLEYPRFQDIFSIAKPESDPIFTENNIPRSMDLTLRRELMTVVGALSHSGTATTLDRVRKLLKENENQNDKLPQTDRARIQAAIDLCVKIAKSKSGGELKTLNDTVRDSDDFETPPKTEGGVIANALTDNATDKRVEEFVSTLF